jgi:hypothetical protein
VNSFYPHALKNQHFKEWQHKPKKELWIKRHLYPHLSQLSPYALSDLYHFGSNNQYYEFFKSQSGFVYSCKFPIDTNAAIQPYRQYFERTQCSDLAVNLFMNKLSQMKLQGYNLVLFRVPASYTMWNMEDEFTVDLINSIKLQAKQMGILTVGIVTKPFKNEGPLKSDKAEKIKLNDNEYNWFEIWDSLYYNFINEHQIYLKKIYATANSVSILNKKSLNEKKELFKIAKLYIKNYL